MAYLSVVGDFDRVSAAGDELEEAMDALDEAKLRVKVAKDSVALEAERAGLESVHYIRGKNGLIISSRRKPTAADGPIFKSMPGYAEGEAPR